MPSRRRTTSAAARRRPLPNWLWLVLGLGIGIAAVLAVDLLTRRDGGLGGHVAGPTSPSKAATRPSNPSSAPIPKPKFDFYTILPETEIVLPEERAPRDPPKATRAEPPEENYYYVLQAAAYASFKEADELKARLALLGLQARIQKVAIEGRGEFHRVRLGPYARLEDLDADAVRLRALGIQPLRLKVKRQTE